MTEVNQRQGSSQNMDARISLNGRRPLFGIESLTPRENEVLQHLSTGIRNAEIATKMGISQKTVENRIRSIFAKLGLRGDETARVKAANMYVFGIKGEALSIVVALRLLRQRREVLNTAYDIYQAALADFQRSRAEYEAILTAAIKEVEMW